MSSYRLVAIAVFGLAWCPALAQSQSAAPATPAPANAAPQLVTVEREGMGTRLQILVYTDQPEKARRAITRAFGEMQRVADLMSEWRKDSDISRLNQASGKEAVPINKETLHVLAKGKEISARTKGRFAVTWAALSGLWDFSPGQTAPRVPSASKARERAGLVDDSKLTIDQGAGTAKLGESGMAVGLGGIAKGYAMDQGLKSMLDAGFDNVLVFAGGDLVARGKKGNKPWVVGVQDPGAPGYFAVLPAKNGAIATSGDYERYIEVDGKRYHHILDPRTGMPANGVRSATVLAPDGIQADALATSVFIMGAKEGMEFIEASPELEGVIIDSNSELLISSGLKNDLRVVRQPTK